MLVYQRVNGRISQTIYPWMNYHFPQFFFLMAINAGPYPIPRETPKNILLGMYIYIYVYKVIHIISISIYIYLRSNIQYLKSISIPIYIYIYTYIYVYISLSLYLYLYISLSLYLYLYLYLYISLYVPWYRHYWWVHFPHLLASYPTYIPMISGLWYTRNTLLPRAAAGWVASRLGWVRRWRRHAVEGAAVDISGDCFAVVGV